MFQVVLWAVMPGSVAIRYQTVGGLCCLYLQGYFSAHLMNFIFMNWFWICICLVSSMFHSYWILCFPNVWKSGDRTRRGTSFRKWKPVLGCRTTEEKCIVCCFFLIFNNSILWPVNFTAML